MSSFHLQITTPDGLAFDGEAERLLVRTIEGDVTILPRHIDYVTAVGYGMARVTVDGQVRKAACIGGLLSVIDGKVRLVPTTFEWEEDIDRERAQRAKEEAERRLAKKREDKREMLLAEAKLKRAMVRLMVKD